MYIYINRVDSHLALPKPTSIKEYVPAEEVLHIDEGDAQRLEGALINTYGRVLVKELKLKKLYILM